MKSAVVIPMILMSLFVATEALAGRGASFTAVNDADEPVPVAVQELPKVANRPMVTVRLTEATTTGDAGGIWAMEAMCQAEYPGSNFCSRQELEGVVNSGGVIRWDLDPTQRGRVWVAGTAMSDTACRSWTNGSEGQSGTGFRISDRLFSVQMRCDYARPLACCE